MATFTTVEFSHLLEDRFDAECYRPELLEVERRVSTHRPRRLDALASVGDGNHMSVAGDFCESGVRYLKGAELSDFFIDDSDPTYISPSVHASMTRAQVAPGDVLLSVIGSVGPVALVTDKYERLSCSCKLAILRPHGIAGAMLAAYLLSPTGQGLLLRRNRGSVQQGIVLPDLRSFPVPKFSDSVTGKVVRLLTDAAAEKRRGDACYPEAQAEILERLGWKQLRRKPAELFYISSMKAVAAKERSDAEFFHPQFARLRTQISKHGTTLGDLVTRFDKGTQPQAYVDDGEVRVVKSKHVSERGVSLGGCERTDISTWDNVSARLVEGDLVINSTGRGTLGRAAVIPRHNGKAVAAVDVIIARLRRDLVEPEYAALFLNSPAGLAQSEQFQTGSSGQLHLYPRHFAQFAIFTPRLGTGAIDLAWQRSLAAKVAAARAAASAVREKLKRAVLLVEASLA